MENGNANVINSSFYNNELVWLDDGFYCTSKSIFRTSTSDTTLNVVNSIIRDDTTEDPAINPFNLAAASITHSNVQGVDITQDMNLDDDSCIASELSPIQATITTTEYDFDTLQSIITVSETTSGSYDNTINVGFTETPDAPEYVARDLSPGTYFFAVTAYDYSGNESDFSEEVSKTIH